MPDRDEFPPSVTRPLAARVGGRCSRFECGRETSGPQEDETKAINIGVAAHITAAAPGGPRYDPTLTHEARRGSANAIWLCQSCAKLIDNDVTRYPAETLRRWKALSEQMAVFRLENPTPPNHLERSVRELDDLMPALLDEMAADLKQHPLLREFILKKRTWSYWYDHKLLEYYYEEHEDLDAQVRLLQNHSLIRDITHNNTKRYTIEEDFARYLRGRPILTSAPPAGEAAAPQS